MRTRSGRRSRKPNQESGQAMIFVVLALGLFLIGAMAFAIDLGNRYFHSQAAQTAADAACTAGAMDWLKVRTDNIGTAPYPGHFTPGTNFDCNTTTPNSNTVSTSNPSPCVYAALNGYRSTLSQGSAATGTLGDNVSVIFNGTAPPGVPTTGTSIMEVDLIDNTPAFFAGLLAGRTTQTIRAIAKCGVQQVASPIPLIVLDPANYDSKPPIQSALEIGGTPTIKIYGGPQQSIQVNSLQANAITSGNWGSSLIDLSQGGPTNTGSSLGVSGGPLGPGPSNLCNPGSSGFCSGTTGTWMSPHSQIQDPFQNMTAPTTAGLLPTYTLTARAGPTGTVADGVNGCSSKGGSCDIYLPGYYAGGICVGNGGCSFGSAAVFAEGLYVLGGAGLTLKSTSCVRMYSVASAAPYNGWGGATFYFTGAATSTLNVNSNSGSPTSGCNATMTVGSGGPTGVGVSCDVNSSTHLPGNLTGSTVLTGNVLLAPCRGPYGDPYLAAGNTPPTNPGTQRGILFFQDRTLKSVQALGGGGGTYAMAGTFYFHSCSSGTGGPPPCTQPTGATSQGTYYNDELTMDGGSGSTSYILGEIIVDNLHMQGTPTIFMDLNPTSAQNILKAALYQ
jgi:hypothetical protein